MQRSLHNMAALGLALRIPSLTHWAAPLLPCARMPGVLLAIAYTSLLLYLMRRMPFYARVPGLSMRCVSGLFLLKVAAGTALWAVYTMVYSDRATADIFKYFDDGAVMFNALHERPMDFFRMLFSVGNDSPWFDEQYYRKMNHWYRQWESNLHNDAHTIIRFNAALRFVSFGEFHVHTVAAAFLSFTGLLALYRAFVGLLPGRERALAIVIFLLPSVLFWASGVLKESLLFFGLGILLWQFQKLVRGKVRAPYGGLLLMAGACVLLFHLKLYVIASLLPALGILLMARMAPRMHVIGRTVVVLLTFTLLGVNIGNLMPGFDVLATIAVKQKDFIGLAEATDPGSYVAPPRLEPNLASFIRNAPYALFITFLGPLVHPSPGPFGLASSLENLLLIVLLILFLRFRCPWRQINGDLLLALAVVVLLMALVIGWTTPVMGALVRYRTPLLPFLFIAALYVMDHRTLIARWPRLRPFISA